MNYEKLDKKYEPYIVEGYTGIEFWLDDEYNRNVSELLDAIIQIYPEFKLSQLKLKFDKIRFYTNLPYILQHLAEEYIEEEYENYKRRNEKDSE